MICGSRLRSLENPGSRNPSPVSVSKYRVDTSKSTSDGRPQPGMPGACRRQCLAHSRFGDHRQAPLDGAVGHRRRLRSRSSTRTASNLLVGSMIRANTRSRSTSSPSSTRSNPSTRRPGTAPPTDDRPANSTISNGPPAAPVASRPRSSPAGLRPDVGGRGLQRLHLGVVVGRTEMLDRARPAPRGPHDLHRGRPRSGLHGAHVGHRPHPTSPDLVHTFRPNPQANPQLNTLRSRRRQNVAQVRFQWWPITTHIKAAAALAITRHWHVSAEIHPPTPRTRSGTLLSAGPRFES